MGLSWLSRYAESYFKSSYYSTINIALHNRVKKEGSKKVKRYERASRAERCNMKREMVYLTMLISAEEYEE